MRQNIILAFDGSPVRLDSLLSAEKLPTWQDDRLWLVAIIPRPVQACVYEPDFFNSSISVDEFEEIKNRLHKGRDHLSTQGFKVNVKLGYLDSRAAITQFLSDLNPDLLVTTRNTRKWRCSRWRKESLASFVIDASPCATLIV